MAGRVGAIMENRLAGRVLRRASPSRTTSRPSATWARKPSSCRRTWGRKAIRYTPDGLRDYIRAMLDAGITEAEIDIMARQNPARLLGLDPW